MGFFEIVGATALGATIPVVLSRYLDGHARRRQGEALSKTGLGRYMQWVITSLDKNAGQLANELTPQSSSDKDE